MKNFENKVSQAYENVDAKTNLVQLQEETKNNIDNVIDSSKITKELAEIFGLNKEKINQMTQNETSEVASDNEVNTMEAQLAKMFGKYDEMISLNNETQKQKPLSIASVLADFDKYEERVAA